MKNFVIKGNFCWSVDIEKVCCEQNAYLVCEDGVCAGVFHELPERYAGLPLTDFGDKLILPGMADLHVHAPQFAFRGLGMDMELMDWLKTYAFPEEAKYQDLDYADRAYTQFADRMRRSATTRAAVFATLHVPATELLMDKMEASGLISYVGKVNMDRNGPDYLCEKSAQASLEATERWICDTKSKYQRTRPILTPRFIPSCTDELMHGIRRLVEKYDLPVQSHLSENFSEIEFVQSLCRDSKFYGDAYDRYGLFGGDHPCIMAHCVHSGEAEIELMRKNGVFAAHSPLSNANLSSGAAPVGKLFREFVNVGLASDIAAGESENLFRSISAAIRASKLRWRMLDQEIYPLTVDQAFYIATFGGGKFFGKVGSFDSGYEFDAIVVDDSTIPHPQELDLHQRLERTLYLADDRHLCAKFVAGTRLF